MAATLVGKVVSAQEGRFLLARPDGQMHLLILTPGAGIEPQDLPDLVRRGCLVTVATEPSQGRRAALALRVDAVRPHPRRQA